MLVAVGGLPACTMRALPILIFALSLALGPGLDSAAGANAPVALTPAALAPIAEIVHSEIAARHIPGAVVIVGQGDATLYRRAFGLRREGLVRTPMTADAIFDLASLTKVVATTTAVMQLVERGKLRLDAPAADYWPRFGAAGKSAVTIRELLTHYSGLKADLSPAGRWSGYGAAMNLLAADRPRFAPGTRYLYSDENFAALGELVRRVAGLPLDVYCARNIFQPLGMDDTRFDPPDDEGGRIAPTESRSRAPATVNDPTARRMGGVAGHAGLFSTADDLARFARMLLGGGRLGGARILAPSSVALMTTPQSPPGATRWRGLGWDVAAPFASDRDRLFPAGSYGHTGYTGTMMWIDPVTRVYVIVLTNRTYPDGGGDARPLRKRIIDLICAAAGPLAPAQIAAAVPGLERYYPDGAAPAVAAGIDVLASEDFAPLRGLRIGLITNQTGRDAAGAADSDLLRAAPGVKLVAIFTPEHGLAGDRDGRIASRTDPATGLPIFSLYGDVTRPTPAMLDGIDALVFDLQDAGARFYTYVATMAYAMRAAAARRIEFFVLDRPDPIDAAVVQGPMLDPALESFTGYFPMPVRYGMTIGELARMFNAENHLGARLHVVAMRGYRRGDWYDETGLRWIDPSPNLRSLAEAALYPGVALVEGGNLSVGRGTPTPFELAGAPWIDGARLADYLNRRGISGVAFAPADFSPAAAPYRGRLCHGVRIKLTNRDQLDSPALGVELIGALRRLYPAKFRVGDTLGMIGSRRALEALERGDDPRVVARGWRPPLRAFDGMRAKYLIY